MKANPSRNTLRLIRELDVGLGIGDPVSVRPVLRKVGVDRITVKRDGDGWVFDGFADLGRLVQSAHAKGGEAPSGSINRAGAGALPTGARLRRPPTPAAR